MTDVVKSKSNDKVFSNFHTKSNSAGTLCLFQKGCLMKLVDCNEIYGLKFK